MCQIDLLTVTQIWHHTFYDILHVAPEEQPVMLTETVFPPPRSREKMVEYMIETFNVPKFFVGIQPVFALYASGRVNGIVIESGHGASHTISVCDGYMLPHATQRSTVAGASITEQLLDELVAKGYNLNREDHLDIVRDIKEKICCAAIDNANLFTTTQPLIEKTYELPDGEVITIGNERLRCVEPLFSDDAPESCSLSRMARETLERCNVDIIREMYGNIVLAGGSTLIPGVHDRLQNELGRLHPTLKCNVIAPSDRKISAWIGGSILASCAEFRDKWITKDEYDEQYVSFLLD
jgi:actin